MAFNVCACVPWKIIILVIFWKEVYMLPNTVVADVTVNDLLSCEEGWKPYDQYCFKLFNTVLNWTAASNDCKRMGGHLASIHSKEQNDFMENFYTGGSGYMVWIGLRDHDLDGLFMWHDESNVTYTNWHPYEPYGNYTSGDCVELCLSKASFFQFGKWLVMKCNSTLQYMCQKKFVTTINTSSNIDSETTTALTSKDDLDSLQAFIHLDTDYDHATIIKYLSQDEEKWDPYVDILPNTVVDDVSVKDISPCEEDWKPYDQYCFKLVRSALNWTAASNACKRMGGHLASIHSKEQNEFTETFYTEDASESVWIGLRDHDWDGIFVWDDGSEVIYTEWDRGEPIGFYPSGDCVLLYLEKDGVFQFGKWIVYECTNYKHYLCQKKFDMLPNTVVNNVSVKDISTCEEGWKPFDQDCFKLVKIPLKWMDASKDCKKLGGHLASIHYKEQNDFIETFYNGGYTEVLWIGLHEHDLEGIFVWDDESDVTYTNWNIDEPHGHYKHACVAISLGKAIFSENKKWSLQNCERIFFYVCQKKSTPLSAKADLAGTNATPLSAKANMAGKNATPLSAKADMAGTNGNIFRRLLLKQELYMILHTRLVWNPHCYRLPQPRLRCHIGYCYCYHSTCSHRVSGFDGRNNLQ